MTRPGGRFGAGRVFMDVDAIEQGADSVEAIEQVLAAAGGTAGEDLAARRGRLLGEAERIASSITDKYWKAAALASVATALSAS